MYGPQVEYVRSVPFHESQVEEEQGDGYAVFSVFVRPSYDFVQQLLWNREQIEVLSPEEFRNQIIGMLRQMQGRYVKRAIYLDRPLSNLSYSVLTHRTTLYVNPSTDTI